VASSTITLTCHPSNLNQVPTATVGTVVKGELASEIESTVSDCTLDRGLLSAQLRGSTEPPAWLASSQRLLERWTSAVIGSESDPADSRAASIGVTEALSFISGAIEDSVGDPGYAGEPGDAR
jgi:hypothetical protein